MDINNELERKVNKDFLYRQNKYSTGKLELDKKFVRSRLLFNLLQFLMFFLIVGIALLIVFHFRNPSIKYHDYKYNIQTDLAEMKIGDTVFFNPYGEITFSDKLVARFQDKNVYVGKIKLLPQGLNPKTKKQVEANTYIIESLNQEETGEIEIKKENIFGFTNEMIKNNNSSNNTSDNLNDN